MTQTHNRVLDIVGFGIGGLQNTTLGANQVIAEAEVVFCLVTSADVRGFLEAHNKLHYIDLLPCYAPGRTANEVYEDIVSSICALNVEWARGVFLVEGNPQLYNIPVRMIRHRGAALGWQIRVHPAVSSLDLILIDLDLEIEEGGVQILDAARMLRDGTPIYPKIGCLLLQLAACSSSAFVEADQQSATDYKLLQQWLLRYYQSEDAFVLIRSATHSRDEALIVRSTIGTFPTIARQFDYNCSAYIPPIP